MKKSIFRTVLLITSCWFLGLMPTFFYAQSPPVWATYYGGAGVDVSTGVATDVSGNVYLSGNTNSYSGIASGGFQNTFLGTPLEDENAFLVKFDASGARLWATYYGGKGITEGNCVATDASGNVYLAGYTETPDTIITAVSPGQEGPFWAGTVVDLGLGDVTWNTPGNAAGSDSATYAVTGGGFGTCPGGCYSSFLQATNFGITIPAGMVVAGIEVRVQWYSDNFNIYNSSTSLVVGGVIAGTPNATLFIDATPTVTTFGDSLDTWGLSLTKADVEDPDFGVALQFTDDFATGNVYVARINITVHYAASLNITNSNISNPAYHNNTYNMQCTNCSGNPSKRVY